MRKIRFNQLSLVLFLIALALTTSAAAFAQEEKQPLTINVVDATTGGAVKNIIVTIESGAGVAEQSIITGSEGAVNTFLAPGSYRIRVEMSIFGFPVTLSTHQLVVNKPTEFTVIVSTFLIPVQYIPPVIYGAVGVLALSGIYMIVKQVTGFRKPIRPVDPDTKMSCGVAAEGSVWKPPERPRDPVTGQECSIVMEGSVWKPPERPKDETGKDCNIVHQGTVWKPSEPERPKDPDTGQECSIVTEGSVWKPPERPTDPETGETCSIVSGGKVWKPGETPERPTDPDTGQECSIVVNGTVWKPPERPKDETGKDCSIAHQGTVWKPRQQGK